MDCIKFKNGLECHIANLSSKTTLFENHNIRISHINNLEPDIYTGSIATEFISFLIYYN